MLEKVRHDEHVKGGDTTQTLYSFADNIGNDVIPSSTPDDGDYDKLHVPKTRNDVVAAEVYNHVNPNTESIYDELK